MSAIVETVETGRVTRRFLMCPPAFFDVVYTINPWMDPGRPTDARLAVAQWNTLRSAYEAAGHVVETITPEPDLPDMVFAANSAFVLDGIALLARFHHPERRPEEAAYERWFRAHGLEVRRTAHGHEGEGDVMAAGGVILAGTGFRTDLAAHREIAETFGREVLTLRLIDARFYHLDTALAVLGDDCVAYFPGAFSEESRRLLARRFPDALIVNERDASAFACNSTSDGAHVFLPSGCDGFAGALERNGFEPIPVELSELRKAGGSVKCCTLELREGAAR